jgi:hypothetical protein
MILPRTITARKFINALLKDGFALVRWTAQMSSLFLPLHNP